MPPARRRRARPLVGLLCTLVLAATAPSSPAEPPSAGLRSQRTALDGRERSLLYALYAQEAQLGRAQAAARAAEQRALALEQQAVALHDEVALARRNVTRSQQVLAAQLRAMYQRPQVDPIQVVLGAGSLEAALAEISALRRVASSEGAIVAQARGARVQLTASLRSLQGTLAAARAQRDDLERSVRDIERRRAARARLLANVRAERSRLSSEIDRLDAEARAAAARSATLAASAPSSARQVSAATTAPAPQPEPVLPAGSDLPSTSGTLILTATAYSLTGGTASGLPAGPGICAVDPSVIPLGSRLEISGYGSCVAADTGSAIVGARVDVWLPPGPAEGFGVRTVSVRVH